MVLETCFKTATRVSIAQLTNNLWVNNILIAIVASMRANLHINVPLIRVRIIHVGIDHVCIIQSKYNIKVFEGATKICSSHPIIRMNRVCTNRSEFVLNEENQPVIKMLFASTGNL